MPILQISSLNRYFGNEPNRVHVLKDIDLSIEKGEFLAIIGQSGSGKSTLMNILGCLDSPTSGSYKIDNCEVSQMNSQQLAALRRKKFGFIFQRYNLLSSLNGVENIALPAVYLGVEKKKRQQRAYELLQRLELQGKENNKPTELSGGQQQRVSIGRALMNGGEIILADEPTGALDSQSGEMVMEILQELHRQGHTVILITHDAHIASFAHRIIEIKDGEIISDKSGKKKKSVAGFIAPTNEKISWLFYRDQFLESFSMSLQAIIAHKLRSFLTMLGIIIGIASVVSMVALGNGTQQKIIQQISSMGTNTITIYPGEGFGDRFSEKVKTLSSSDAQILQRQTYVQSVTPMSNSSGILTYQNISVTVNFFGVGEQYFDVKGLQLDSGRLLTTADVNKSRQVAVIDYNTKNKLFRNGENPIGRIIMINKRPLQIVGTVKKEENSPFAEDSLQVWTPYTTVMQKITGSKNISSITVLIKEDVNTSMAEKKIKELLTLRHGSKDFFTQNVDSIKKNVESATGTMTLLISGIAVISLLVGGIGVMNIMLVSVTERTKEIGIRMAIGARQSNILQQFLIEAMVLCFFGGITGVALSFIIAQIFNTIMTDFVMSLSLPSIVIAVASSSLIGLLFGFLPAHNASQLRPIEALSRE